MNEPGDEVEDCSVWLYVVDESTVITVDDIERNVAYGGGMMECYINNQSSDLLSVVHH